MCELVFQQEECKIKSGKAENTSRFNHHKASEGNDEAAFSSFT